MILEVATPACAAEDLGDEIVALNVSTGVYASLRGLAAALWRDFAAGHSVTELAAELAASGGDLAPDAIDALATQLRELGLMRERSQRLTAGALQPATAASAAALAIEFEVFDDMKDLIMSDPIHDVDEDLGWPNLRPQ